MTDEELTKIIKENSENIKIPQSISPENMQKKLIEHKSKKKNSKYKYVLISAALICIVMTSFILNTKTLNNEKNVKVVSTSESYDSLYWKFKGYEKNNYSKITGRMNDDNKKSADTGASVATAESVSNYSKTNTQVMGIDEGDIVKNDDEYIYALTNDVDQIKVKIVKATNGITNEIATINTGITVSYNMGEMYIDNNKLILIATIQNNNNCETKVLFYDIKNKENPVLISTLSQDGYYSSSRLVGDKLYIFSNFYFYNIDEVKNNEFIPKVNNKLIDPDKICVPSEVASESYMVLTSVDLKSPTDYLDKKAIVASGDTFYVSENNIYVVSNLYTKNSSEIMKFSYNNGTINAAGEATIEGQMNNQFSLDEDNGYLRVVATINDSNNNFILTDSIGESTPEDSDMNIERNSLYILDKNMNKVSEITDIAKGERIYSARFIGNMGYFVTYKKVDPLFSVDLSDPYNPKIVGELKIPGFSTYLHPYGKGLLLGIGDETDQSDTKRAGLKLSMFNIQDPSNVYENNKLVLDYDYSEALDNHKAVLIDKDKNLIGFSAYVYCYNDEYKNDFLVFKYFKNEGFKQVLAVPLEKYSYINVRGIYIGDYLFVIYEGKIIKTVSLSSLN